MLVHEVRPERLPCRDLAVGVEDGFVPRIAVRRLSVAAG